MAQKSKSSQQYNKIYQHCKGIILKLQLTREQPDAEKKHFPHCDLCQILSHLLFPLASTSFSALHQLSDHFLNSVEGFHPAQETVLEPHNERGGVEGNHELVM